MLIYVAGKYSTGDVEENVALARKVAIELTQLGHAVFTPHLNFYHFEQDLPHRTHDEYLREDENILSRCDGIVMLPGWTDSPGANREYDYAEKIGLPVYQYPDVPDIHPTEVRCPEQAQAFRELTGKMYRIHLDKNADYCVAPNTPVLTGDLMWVPISELKKGDTLVGFDENAVSGNKRRMYRETEVLSVSRVSLPSYKLTMEDGSELISSSKHPWLVKSGATSRWLETERLQESGVFKNPSKIIRMQDLWEPDTSYEAGYLAGAYDGEGWLSQTPNHRHGGGSCFRVGFAQRDNAMLDFVKSALDKRGFVYGIEPANGQNTANNIRIKETSKKDLIRFIGEIRPKRLISNIKLDFGMVNQYPVKVVKKEFIGEVELVSIQTSTKTYIANGFGSHNSPANILGTGEVGLITRIWDKVARLMNLSGFDLRVETSVYKQPKAPKNESVEDTLLDLSVYALIGLLLRWGKWGK